MKNLSPVGMKTLKTFHLIFVVMWLGGCLGMALIPFLKSDSPLQLLIRLNISEALDYWILIPGAVCTVLTGAAYGIWTKWGFFLHRWLTVKWIVSIALILVGTFFFHPFNLDMIAEIEMDPEGASLSSPTVLTGMTVLRWAGIQALALMLLIAVSVFKPWKKKSSIV